VSTASLQVIRWGSERARSTPWRGDGRVAHLAPVAGSGALSAPFVRHCLTRLAAQGFTRVVTAALAPGEQPGFLSAGFEIEQHLHLLAHDLSGVPATRPPEGVQLRRGADDDLDAVVAADNEAFDPFWSMDPPGIEEALTATPRSRYRVALNGSVVGYAITGRAGGRGYLQRLAVAPAHQGRGTGRALVVDGLRWLRRWRADQCLVNTQVGNDAAVALYTDLGFRAQPDGLSVLALTLP
jgi:ribosomal protein S18 acetylase RimI-like enzyme